MCTMCVCVGFNYPIDSMNTDEKITMCIIENYLSFKVHIHEGYMLMRVYVNEGMYVYVFVDG